MNYFICFFRPGTLCAFIYKTRKPSLRHFMHLPKNCSMAMVHIDPGFFLLAAFLLLLVPLPWILSIAVSALIHELAHIAVVVYSGGYPTAIRIGPGGIRIDAVISGSRSEIISILAGPAASFSLLGFSRVCPQLAVCGMIHGFFNILPVYPLDGGRLLRCFALAKFPRYTQTILLSAYLCVMLILIILAFLSIYWRNMYFLSIFGTTLFFLAGKTPCKQERIKVQ